MASNTRYEDKPWIAHYDHGVPEKIDYEPICLPEYLERSVNRFPERTALILEGFKISYRQLSEMVNRFATCLNAFGTQKGDRVAILLPNVIPCVTSYYAILKIGAVAVLNNPASSDNELQYQLHNSGAKILITLDLFVDRMVQLRSKTDISQIIYTSFGDYLPFFKSISFTAFSKRKGLSTNVKNADSVYPWKDLMTDYPPEPAQPTLAFDDIAMLQYTGGTTGISKGVMLSHGNLSCQIQQINAWFPTFARSAEIILGALPFFHSFGLTCAMNNAVFAGWENVLVPRPSPENLLAAIRKFKPTFAPLVPTMYINMLDHPDIQKINLTSVKACFSGSAPLPVDVIRRFEGLTGAAISEGFGLTEASPITHANPFQGKRKVGSVGLPFPDTKCRIVDLEDGVTDVPIGETGELLVKGPQVMQGYWKHAQETEETLRDGWLYTGDIAKMDEQGYFYIVDRKKDMIISGGLNVYPREIDEVFFSHPKVQEACAVGIPHPTGGEQLKVFVVLHENETASEEELLNYCKDKMAAYKLPTRIEFRKDLPKSNVGKVLRKVLREEELAGRSEY
jgi:long-chain acyl-CoA synthetase